MLGRLFLWFYCLPIWQAVLVMTLGTVGFVLLEKQLRLLRFWRWLKLCLLAALLAAILHSTLTSRSSQETAVQVLPLFHSYRELLKGGSREILRTNFMNVALFYPAGLIAASLLPGKWPGWARCLPVLLLLTAVSAGIEWYQYRLGLGLCELDDAFHNTVGTLLGILVFLWRANRKQS